MFAAQAESMAGGVQNELGTVTKFPTSATLGVGYRRQIAKFDYDRNRFDYDNIRPDSAYKYMNERYVEDDDMLDKYRNTFLKDVGHYTVRGSYWNNDFHFYGTFIDTFLNNNALGAVAIPLALIPPYNALIFITNGNMDINTG